MNVYDIGDSPIFTKAIGGGPTKVNVVLVWPDDTQEAFAAWEDTPGVFVFDMCPEFDMAGIWTLRWNAYEQSTDSLPKKASEEEFEVRASPFTTPVPVERAAA